jgi:hypothetical protein
MKQSKSLKAVVGASFASLLMLVAATTAHAQATVGLSPAMVVKDFTPGKSLQFEVVVSNGLGTPVTMTSKVRDWWYDKNNQKTFDEPGTHANSMSNWIQVVPEQITIGAQSSSKVKVTVTPPAQASGGYYSVIFFESKPEATTEKTAEGKPIFSNFRLGTLVMMNAANTDHYQIKVTDKKFDPPAANRNLNLEFKLQNLGNSHIFPRVELSMLNEKKELVAKAEGEYKRFLPEQADWLKVNWGGALAPGKYSAVLTVLYGKSQIYTDDFSFEVSE